MIYELAVDFTTSNTGRILHIPPSYYLASVGWNLCDTGRNDSGNTDWRAFFSFDTSSLPDHAQIDGVYFRVRRRTDPTGEPQYYSLKFSIGSFIGATLDGNAGEWTGGAHMITLTVKPADKSTLDLSADGQDPCPHVNKTGSTDIKIWDASTKGTGDNVWGTNFNKYALTGCKLIVDYSVPSATATGTGTASCAAEIVADASATATGTGTASCAAEIVADASATATGTGTASCAAEIVANASATATGVGTASCSAKIVADASATATGVGTAFCSAKLILEPLALHEATIAVASVDTGSLANVSLDVATIAIDSDNMATRGKRRN